MIRFIVFLGSIDMTHLIKQSKIKSMLISIGYFLYKSNNILLLIKSKASALFETLRDTG